MFSLHRRTRHFHFIYTSATVLNTKRINTVAYLTKAINIINLPIHAIKGGTLWRRYVLFTFLKSPCRLDRTIKRLLANFIGECLISYSLKRHQIPLKNTIKLLFTYEMNPPRTPTRYLEISTIKLRNLWQSETSLGARYVSISTSDG